MELAKERDRGKEKETVRQIAAALAAFVAGVLLAVLFSVGLPLGNRNRSVTAVEDKCFEPGEPSYPELDEWERGVKSIPRAAQCLVRGFPIEEAEVELNYRRPYAFGHTNASQDRLALAPYFLAAHDLTLQRSARRMLLDLGPGEFENSSVVWFVRQYPLDFTEYRVFEYRGLFDPPDFHPPSDEIFSKMNHLNRIKYTAPPITNQILSQITVHDEVPSVEDATVTISGVNKNVVGMSRFIRREMRVKPEDTLIVKMDIEGREFAILQEWLKNKYISKVVDEIFVKFYYNDKTAVELFPGEFNKSRDDAQALLKALRAEGFYVHYWP